MTKRISIVFCFFVLAPITLSVSLFFSRYHTSKNILKKTEVVIPLAQYYQGQIENNMVLGQTIVANDAIPVVIENYLRKYKSLMPADTLVTIARQCGVDPRLMVAIAQQETNLGKHMPREDCINAWGYGVHSRGTQCFSTWEEAYETVFCGIAQNYCKKGLCDDPCKMMQKYTPSSNGSWCNGVNQFLDDMITGD